MKRRAFIVAAAATVAAEALPKDQWITVAHLGPNLNGRAYSRGNLRDMAAAAKGTLVGPSDQEMQSVEEALGVATAARLTNDFRVQIQVRWFGGKRAPIGYITPSGIALGIYRCPFGFDAVQKGYRLTAFSVNGESAFDRATPILR